MHAGVVEKGDGPQSQEFDNFWVIPPPMHFARLYMSEPSQPGRRHYQAFEASAACELRDEGARRAPSLHNCLAVPIVLVTQCKHQSLISSGIAAVSSADSAYLVGPCKRIKLLEQQTNNLYGI